MSPAPVAEVASLPAPLAPVDSEEVEDIRSRRRGGATGGFEIGLFQGFRVGGKLVGPAITAVTLRAGVTLAGAHAGGAWLGPLLGVEAEALGDLPVHPAFSLDVATFSAELFYKPIFTPAVGGGLAAVIDPRGPFQARLGCMILLGATEFMVPDVSVGWIW